MRSLVFSSSCRAISIRWPDTNVATVAWEPRRQEIRGGNDKMLHFALLHNDIHKRMGDKSGIGKGVHTPGRTRVPAAPWTPAFLKRQQVESAWWLVNDG